MTPTAVSQIIEAVSKLFIGLGLSMYVVSLGYEDYIAAAAAIVGVTGACSAVGSVIVPPLYGILALFATISIYQ